MKLEREDFCWMCVMKNYFGLKIKYFPAWFWKRNYSLQVDVWKQRMTKLAHMLKHSVRERIPSRHHLGSLALPLRLASHLGDTQLSPQIISVFVGWCGLVRRSLLFVETLAPLQDLALLRADRVRWLRTPSTLGFWGGLAAVEERVPLRQLQPCAWNFAVGWTYCCEPSIFRSCILGFWQRKPARN